MEKSLSLRPTALAYSNLGLAYFYAGRYEEAAAQMEKARDLGPMDYLFWGNLADAYRVKAQWADMARGAYTKAVAMAEKERVKNRDDARLRSILARYYARLGRESAALPEIAEALRLSPQDVDVMYRSVLARISHHLTAEARDKAAITSLRLLTVLTVLFKYASAR